MRQRDLFPRGVPLNTLGAAAHSTQKKCHTLKKKGDIILVSRRFLRLRLSLAGDTKN